MKAFRDNPQTTDKKQGCWIYGDTDEEEKQTLGGDYDEGVTGATHNEEKTGACRRAQNTENPTTHGMYK